MKYNLILENWKKFLVEEETSSSTEEQGAETVNPQTQSPAEQKQNEIDIAVGALESDIKNVIASVKLKGMTANDIKPKLIQLINNLQEAKKKKSGDRCTRIAKRKYDVWPSAYASGAVVKCRQGKIWKGISESATDEEIDYALLLEEIEETNIIEEKWSEKYKRSINCKNPKGFSQKAHCQGRNKNEELELNDELVE
jgi:NRPS condensation-like uncharacterized protein